MTGYEVLDLLGEGSTATVYRARRTDRAGQIVALKVSRSGDLAAAASLRAEAQTLQQIDHPNVIRILDLIDNGTSVAIALQLAAGGSLATALVTRRWTEAEVLSAARELAGAVAECHRLGIVHGDVATTNVLLGADGAVLLADLGAPGASAGTPGFVSPEVAAGGPPSTASDVFGLGKVLEALAAAAPSNVVSAAAAAAAEQRPGDRPTAEDVASLLARPATPGPIATPEGVRTRQFRTVAAKIDTPPTQESASRRRLLVHAPKAAVAAGVLMLATGVVQLLPASSDAHARPRCPAIDTPAAPGAHVIEADVDGDGCPNAIVRTGNVVVVGSDRFVLGSTGDDLYVADWDCDGDATPAVFRPASRRLTVYDSWPTASTGPRQSGTTVVVETPAAPIC